MPVSVTLTRVRFAGPKTGWAVGHFGTVLHTADGGETWQRQLDGTTAAKLALEAAQARAQAMPGSESGRKRLAEAEQLVKDGPDKPFLDLHFFDDRNGVIVGAFNLIFGTHDGGKTWLPLLDRLDESVLAMEEQAINAFPQQSTIRRIFRLRRQLVVLRIELRQHLAGFDALAQLGLALH